MFKMYVRIIKSGKRKKKKAEIIENLENTSSETTQAWKKSLKFFFFVALQRNQAGTAAHSICDNKKLLFQLFRIFNIRGTINFRLSFYLFFSLLRLSQHNSMIQKKKSNLSFTSQLQWRWSFNAIGNGKKLNHIFLSLFSVIRH